MCGQFHVDWDVQRKNVCGSLRANSFIYLNFLVRTQLSSLVHMLHFSMNSRQGFVHEDPGPFLFRMCPLWFRSQSLYRIHYTNARLAKTNPNVSDAFWCRKYPANFIHIFWSFPKLIYFWANIFETISWAYDVVIASNSLSVIFCAPPDTGSSVAMHQVLAFMAVLARFRFS